jgi:hypothetical protein
MAAMLVASMQVARHPECVRWIRQTFGERLLGKDAGRLDAIPVQGAATSFAQGTIAQSFGELNRAKIAVDRELEALDRQIRDKERRAKQDIEKHSAELKRLYHEFRRELVKIPGCASSVRFQELTLTSETSPESLVSALSEECKKSVEDRLANAREEELRLIAEAEKFRVKNDPALSEEAPTDQESRLNDRIKQLGERIAQLQELSDRFTKPEAEGSLLKQSEAIAAVLGQRSQMSSREFYRAETEKRSQLERQLDFIAPQWMTYGYFGGFQALNP